MWDLIIWNSINESNPTNQSDAIVYSKAFDKKAVEKIELLAKKLNFSPLKYSDEKDIFSKLSEKNYHRIFALHLSDSLTKKICREFNEASLNFGFEGLAAYFPPDVNISLVSRIKKYYHFGNLPAPVIFSKSEKIDISKERILHSINQIKQILELKSPFGGQPLQNCNILIGQHFYRHGLIAWEDELSAYSDYVGAKIDQGQKVLWKEHPRSTIPFGNTLKQKWGESFEICNLDPLYSIELFGDELSNCNESAGFCSNSLFNLKDFYSIPTHLITNNDQLHKFKFGEVERLALIHFAGIAHSSGDGKVSIDTILAAFGYNERSIFTRITKPKTNDASWIQKILARPFRLFAK